MVEIEVSTIPDETIDNTIMQALADEFGYLHNVKVRIHTMTWATAWTELFSIASNRKGPDVSHIGGTWVSSLAMMKALRPFRRNEIEAMGGQPAFMAPTWLSATVQNEDTIWSIPWTGFLYTICYRKDFLKKAGIEETGAFKDISALKETVRKLTEAGVEIPWLNPMVVAPYVDYLHIAASWVWSAGGSFIDATGKHLVLDSPEARAGLAAWLSTYVIVPDQYRALQTDEAMDLFSKGRVAAVVANIRRADSFVSGSVDKSVSKNLGATTITYNPWCGGGNFVIWNHAQLNPERERFAVAFVQFMTSKKNNIFWADQVGSMPARIDALDEMYKVGHPLRDMILFASKQGMPYPSVPVWRRIENQMAQTLGDMLNSVHKDSTQDLDALVYNSISPLVRRLNLMLEG